VCHREYHNRRRPLPESRHPDDQRFLDDVRY
jgi:hypothetical protein